MSFLEIIMIGIGLSMDAFAVSISISSLLSTWKRRFFSSFLFGSFQGIMIILGYFFGSFFPFISTYKDIFSFFVLFYVGFHMITHSYQHSSYPSLSFFSFLLLGIATSIDAFCIGFSFSFYLASILSISLMIGMITFLFSILGCLLGIISYRVFSHSSEIFGGILLILLSMHFLLQSF